MKTDLQQPMTYFILGVPRSGTTIVANLFNALEDGICLGEPHWFKVHYPDEKLSNQLPARGFESGNLIANFQKWQQLRKSYLVNLPAEYKEMHCLYCYYLCGYKETYRLGHCLTENIINTHLDLVDFFIVVFRDPVLVHSSQRALGWTEWDRSECFNESYRRLDQLAQHEKAVVVIYEDFIKDPLEYLNARLPFQIEGPLDLQPTGHKFGDPLANRSTEIVDTNRQICLTDEEIEQHKPAGEIWMKWRM